MKNEIILPFTDTKVYFVENKECFAAVMKKHDFDLESSFDESMGGCTTEFDGLNIITVEINKNLVGLDLLQVLVHEIVHVKQIYFRWIGEKNPSNEVEAYLVDDVFTKILDQVCGKKELGALKIEDSDELA